MWLIMGILFLNFEAIKIRNYALIFMIIKSESNKFENDGMKNSFFQCTLFLKVRQIRKVKDSVLKKSNFWLKKRYWKRNNCIELWPIILRQIPPTLIPKLFFWFIRAIIFRECSVVKFVCVVKLAQTSHSAAGCQNAACATYANFACSMFDTSVAAN